MRGNYGAIYRYDLGVFEPCILLITAIIHYAISDGLKGAKTEGYSADMFIDGIGLVTFCTALASVGIHMNIAAMRRQYHKMKKRGKKICAPQKIKTQKLLTLSDL